MNNTHEQKVQILFIPAAMQPVFRHSLATPWGKALQACMRDLKGCDGTQPWLDEVVTVQFLLLTCSALDMFLHTKNTLHITSTS